MSRALPRSTRVSRIANWLNTQKAPIATSLRLEIQSDEGVDVISQWDKSDPKFALDEVAVEIDSALQNVADETESRVNGRLALYTSDGKLWTQFALRADPPEGAQNFEGTAKSLLVQLQKHYELAGLQYFRASDGVNKTLLETVTVLKDLIVTRESRTSELEAEIALLRDKNAEMNAEMMTAEQVTNQAVAAQEEAAKQVEELKNKGQDDASIVKLFGAAIQGSTPTK